MVFDDYTNQRTLYFYFQGLRAPTISRLLENKGIVVSRRGVAKFLKRYLATGTIVRRPGSGAKMKITNEVKWIIEEQMRLDNETTATQLHILLVRLGYSLSLCTVLHCRMTLGWTYRGSAYCQLIREQNKRKTLAWALKFKDDDFSNVVFTDKSSIQQETIGDFAVGSRANHPKASRGKLSTLVPVKKL